MRWSGEGWFDGWATEERGRSGVTMGSEAERKVWFLGGLKAFVDSGSMFEAVEGLEGPDSEASKSSRFCIWDVSVDGASSKVNSVFRLGLTLSCEVGEENSVSSEDGMDSVGVAGVEEG